MRLCGIFARGTRAFGDPQKNALKDMRSGLPLLSRLILSRLTACPRMGRRDEWGYALAYAKRLALAWGYPLGLASRRAPREGERGL